jgi:hypothetical protein
MIHGARLHRKGGKGNKEDMENNVKPPLPVNEGVVGSFPIRPIEIHSDAILRSALSTYLFL